MNEEELKRLKPILEKMASSKVLLTMIKIQRRDYAGRILACMDEGIPRGVANVRLAGSGILLDDPYGTMKVMGLDGIYSHAGCGAAAKHVKDLGLDTDLDVYAREWTEKMARRLGIQYKGHIGEAQLDRPVGFHNALGTLVKDTFEELQTDFPAFRVSTAQGYENALNDVKLSVAIATGDHGLGAEAFRKYPFTIACVAETADELIRQIATFKPLEREYDGLVRVEGMTLGMIR